MKRTLAIAALLTTVGLAAAGGLALAKNARGENDAIADLAQAKITLVQAVSAAEGHAAGKATKAELEHERGRAVYEVEVVTPDRKVFDVKIDAVDGKVLSSQADAVDHGEHDD